MHTSKIIFLICLILIASHVILANDGTWDKLKGPYVIGKIDEISIGYYQQERHIFCADSSEFGTLWKTTDDGLTWQLSHAVEDHHHSRVSMKYDNAEYGWSLVAPQSFEDNDAGPYRTEDNGVFWELRESGLESSKKLYALAVDQNSPDLSIAFVGGEGDLAHDFKKLFKTTDGGNHWELSQQGIPDGEFGRVCDIAVCLNSSDYLFCTYRGLPEGGVFRSTDQGSTWEQIFFLPPGIDFGAIAVNPNDPRHVIFIVNDDPGHGIIKIFKSYNALDDPPDWYFIELPGHGVNHCVRIDRNGDAYIPLDDFNNFIIRYRGDGGIDYLPTEGGIIGDRSGRSVAIDYFDQNIICAGTRYTFYFSTDHGAIFEERANGANPVTCLRYLDVDFPQVCAATRCQSFSNLMFKTSNGGFSWFITQSNYGDFRGKGMEKDWGEPNLWFCVMNAGSGQLLQGRLLITWDSGDTWHPNEPWGSKPIECIRPDYLSDYLYIGGWPHPSAFRGEFYRSPNNGGNWENFNVHDDTDVRAIDIHPVSAEILIVADINGGVFRSSDRGEHWSEINEGLTNINAIKIQYCPNNPSDAIVGTLAGVFKSTNMETASPFWSAANYGCAEGIVEALDFHASNNSIISLSLNENDVGRFYISADTARSWVKVDAGLNDYIAYNIAADVDHPDTFYVATDNGVFKLKNPVKSGIVSGVDTWGPGKVIVNGDITILENAALTIAAPCTVLMVYDFDILESGSDNARTEIIVEGALIANGNYLNPIVFKSSKPTNPGAGDWYGIRVMHEASLTLNHTTIEHAVDAITASSGSNIELTGCTIANSSQSGITVTIPDRVVISQSQFVDNNLYAISIMNWFGEVALTDIEISEVNRYGIRYFGLSPDEDIPLIDNVEIVYYDGPNMVPPPFYGIEFGPEITGETPMGRISNVYIEGYEDGIYLDGTIEGITVGPNAQCIYNLNGIFLYGAWAEISGSEGINVFENNEVSGLLSAGSAGKVRYSNFIGSPWCVNVEKNGDVIDFGVVEPEEEWGNNSLVADPEITQMLFYVNDCVFDYPAQMNWWNSDDHQYIESMVSGCVIWNPFRDGPPEAPKPASGKPGLPSRLTLAQAYPNPFNAQTTIQFILPKSATVSVKIYNILGQEIRELYNSHAEAGETSVIWDGKDNSGSAVASGIYFCAVQANDEAKVNKMLLLK